MAKAKRVTPEPPQVAMPQCPDCKWWLYRGGKSDALADHQAEGCSVVLQRRIADLEAEKRKTTEATEWCVDCNDSLDGEGICQMCAIIRESKAIADLEAEPCARCHGSKVIFHDNVTDQCPSCVP